MHTAAASALPISTHFASPLRAVAVAIAQGGGWCTSIDDCHSRSKSAIGSSTSWTDANCTAGSDQYPCSYDGGPHGCAPLGVAVCKLLLASEWA